MRKSKFSQEEIEVVLGKLEKGSFSIEDVCKKMDVTLATVYNWKRKYSGDKQPSLFNKIKDLESENLQLKQLVANLSLEKQDLVNLLRKKNIINP